MPLRNLAVATAAALVALAIPDDLAAETPRSPPHPRQLGGAILELGKQAGIFRKHGLDLDILYTQGRRDAAGRRLRIGRHRAEREVLGSLGAYGKGAHPHHRREFHRLARDLLVVAAKSLLRSMREVDGQDLLSTNGASSHIVVLHFINEYGLKAKPVATGDAAATITQIMSGQVDVGWAVAPFVLDLLDKGEARMIARGSDIAAVRGQTIRVQITNAQNLATKKDARALHEGLQRDRRLDVFQPRGGAALSRLLRAVGLRSGSCSRSSSRRRVCRRRRSRPWQEHEDAVQFKFCRRRSGRTSSRS